MLNDGNKAPPLSRFGLSQVMVGLSSGHMRGQKGQVSVSVVADRHPVFQTTAEQCNRCFFKVSHFVFGVTHFLITKQKQLRVL